MRRPLIVSSLLLVAVVALAGCGEEVAAQQPHSWPDVVYANAWWLGAAVLIVAFGVADRLRQPRRQRPPDPVRRDDGGEGGDD